MTETRWWKHIKPNLENMTLRDAARKAGFNQSAFTRWKNGAKADPEFVVKFARAFNLNVLEALVEAEFISEEEASLTEVEVGGISLSKASDDDLMNEVLHRLKRSSNAYDAPVGSPEKPKVQHPRFEIVSDAEVEGALADVRNGLAAAKGDVDDYDEPEAP